jgi:hypothetical protein
MKKLLGDLELEEVRSKKLPGIFATGTSMFVCSPSVVRAV